MSKEFDLLNEGLDSLFLLYGIKEEKKKPTASKRTSINEAVDDKCEGGKCKYGRKTIKCKNGTCKNKKNASAKVNMAEESCRNGKCNESADEPVFFKTPETIPDFTHMTVKCKKCGKEFKTPFTKQDMIDINHGKKSKDDIMSTCPECRDKNTEVEEAAQRLPRHRRPVESELDECDSRRKACKEALRKRKSCVKEAAEGRTPIFTIDIPGVKTVGDKEAVKGSARKPIFRIDDSKLLKEADGEIPEDDSAEVKTERRGGRKKAQDKTIDTRGINPKYFKQMRDDDDREQQLKDYKMWKDEQDRKEREEWDDSRADYKARKSEADARTRRYNNMTRQQQIDFNQDERRQKIAGLTAKRDAIGQELDRQEIDKVTGNRAGLAIPDTIPDIERNSSSYKQYIKDKKTLNKKFGELGPNWEVQKTASDDLKKLAKKVRDYEEYLTRNYSGHNPKVDEYKNLGDRIDKIQRLIDTQLTAEQEMEISKQYQDEYWKKLEDELKNNPNRLQKAMAVNNIRRGSVFDRGMKRVGDKCKVKTEADREIIRQIGGAYGDKYKPTDSEVNKMKDATIDEWAAFLQDHYPVPQEIIDGSNKLSDVINKALGVNPSIEKSASKIAAMADRARAARAEIRQDLEKEFRNFHNEEDDEVDSYTGDKIDAYVKPVDDDSEDEQPAEPKKRGRKPSKVKEEIERHPFRDVRRIRERLRRKNEGLAPGDIRNRDLPFGQRPLSLGINKKNGEKSYAEIFLSPENKAIIDAFGDALLGDETLTKYDLGQLIEYLFETDGITQSERQFLKQLIVNDEDVLNAYRHIYNSILAADKEKLKTVKGTSTETDSLLNRA